MSEENIWDTSKLVAPRHVDDSFVGKITHAEQRLNRWGKQEVYLEIQPDGKQFIRKQWFVVSKSAESGWGKFILALDELGCVPQNGDVRELIGLTFFWKPTVISYLDKDGKKRETERLIPSELVSGQLRKIVKKEETEEDKETKPEPEAEKKPKESEKKPKEPEKTEEVKDEKPVTKYTLDDVKRKLIEFIGDEPLTMQDIFGEMIKYSYRKRDTMLAVGALEKEGLLKKNDDGTIVACDDNANNKGE